MGIAHRVYIYRRRRRGRRCFSASTPFRHFRSLTLETLQCQLAAWMLQARLWPACLVKGIGVAGKGPQDGPAQGVDRVVSSGPIFGLDPLCLWASCSLNMVGGEEMGQSPSLGFGAIPTMYCEATVVGSQMENWNGFECLYHPPHCSTKNLSVRTTQKPQLPPSVRHSYSKIPNTCSRKPLQNGSQ